MKLQEIAQTAVGGLFGTVKTLFNETPPNSNNIALTLTDEEFIAKAKADDTMDCSAHFVGNGNELNLPIKIKYVNELAVDRMIINDYSQLPAVNNFSVDSCELGDGFVEYIYSHVLQKIEVVNSKLRMDDVIDLIFSRNDFAYQFKVYPDWIRMARGNLSRCKITYQFNRAAPETVYFNDEFDAQEWLISNLDTKKWFK